MFSFQRSISFPDRENDIITFGELLVDLISEDYDERTEGSAYRPFFGGSPANIAMNTASLGISSKIVASVGKDRLGEFLLNRLGKASMNTELVNQCEHATSVVLLNKSKGTPVPIFYRGADYQLQLKDELRSALLSSKIIHFSSWPLSRQPARATVESLIKLAKSNGVLVGFDPNYHPMLWDHNEDGIALMKSMISKADIVKPSEDDAERLFGADKPENQIEKFLQLGAKLVVLTLGEHGAIASNGQETVSFPTLASRVVDTTGAGDAFWSGFYASIVKGYTLSLALKLGFAVSAYKLQYVGAIVELPLLEEIKQRYDG